MTPPPTSQFLTVDPALLLADWRLSRLSRGYGAQIPSEAGLQ